MVLFLEGIHFVQSALALTYGQLGGITESLPFVLVSCQIKLWRGKTDDPD